MPQADSSVVVEDEVVDEQEQDEGAAPAAGETPEASADQPDDAAAADDAQGDEPEEVTVTIGEDSPPPQDDEKPAPAWVKDLRKSNREKDRRIRELEARLQTPASAAPVPVVLGEKPTLEGCGWDADKFEADLEAWHSRKRQADDQIRQREQAEQTARTAWQTKLDSFTKAKAALKVPDYEDAELAVQDALNVTQQGVILQGAENPALVVYALGKSPKLAKELAAITDPVKFAFAVAKLETQVKVTPRRTAPPPERVVRSSVPGAAAVDSALERLRAEADRTGDRTKVAAYLRTKKAAA